MSDYYLLQTGILDWFAQNPLFAVSLFSLLLLVAFAIYIKLFVRIFYEGTPYRHYRKGRLLRESDRGGLVVLIPFLDRLEIISPSEPSIEDIADSLENND